MFGLSGLLAGILLLLAGIFLVFFFPGVTEHQPEADAYTGIVLGIIFLIAGAVLVFI
ncbi:MAG: hypothetical protein HY520_01770 [Candidatus Aenigmarchaeota archaeon]|nr:hypothetical protein [Candidatus Aenigmarchaeota archaeon]